MLPYLDYVSKRRFKKTFGHVLHIFIPCISGFLFYFPLIKCLLFLLHLTVMLLSTVASWLDERLEQISQCVFSVCSLESAKPSSLQQCWMIQFLCMNCITNMQKVSSLKQRIFREFQCSSLHFASK